MNRASIKPSTVHNTAVEGGALRANPAHAMRLPKAAKGDTLFLRPEQVAALAEAIRPRCTAP